MNEGTRSPGASTEGGVTGAISNSSFTSQASSSSTPSESFSKSSFSSNNTAKSSSISTTRAITYSSSASATGSATSSIAGKTICSSTIASSFPRLEELFNEPKTKKSKDKSNDVEPESVRKVSDAPIIKDWVSDDEAEKVEKKEVKPSIKRINFVKATTDNNPKETVKNGVQPKQNTH
nr:hypothetical protein [Tanacetum cinerariifolium]